jgi:hypothetical protein
MGGANVSYQLLYPLNPLKTGCLVIFIWRHAPAVGLACCVEGEANVLKEAASYSWVAYREGVCWHVYASLPRRKNQYLPPSNLKSQPHQPDIIPPDQALSVREYCQSTTLPLFLVVSGGAACSCLGLFR